METLHKKHARLWKEGVTVDFPRIKPDPVIMAAMRRDLAWYRQMVELPFGAAMIELRNKLIEDFRRIAEEKLNLVSPPVQPPAARPPSLRKRSSPRKPVRAAHGRGVAVRARGPKR